MPMRTVRARARASEPGHTDNGRIDGRRRVTKRTSCALYMCVCACVCVEGDKKKVCVCVCVWGGGIVVRAVV